jgi:hypothetical protein
MHKRYLVVVVCCAAVTFAGCGSSQTNTNQVAHSTGSVSPGVFRGDLNSLCQAAKTAGGASLAKAAAALDQALPQFKAITAPAGQQADYSKFLAHLQALAAAVKNRNSGAARQEADKLGALARQLHVSGCTF